MDEGAADYVPTPALVAPPPDHPFISFGKQQLRGAEKIGGKVLEGLGTFGGLLSAPIGLAIANRPGASDVERRVFDSIPRQTLDGDEASPFDVFATARKYNQVTDLATGALEQVGSDPNESFPAHLAGAAGFSIGTLGPVALLRKAGFKSVGAFGRGLKGAPAPAVIPALPAPRAQLALPPGPIPMRGAIAQPRPGAEFFGGQGRPVTTTAPTEFEAIRRVLTPKPDPTDAAFRSNTGPGVTEDFSTWFKAREAATAAKAGVPSSIASRTPPAAPHLPVPAQRPPLSLRQRVGDLTPVGREDLAGRFAKPSDVPPLPLDELKARIAGPRVNVPLDAEQLAAQARTKTRAQAENSAMTSMAVEARAPKGALAETGITGRLVGRAMGRGGSQVGRVRNVAPLDATPNDVQASLVRQSKVHDANEAAIAAVRNLVNAPAGASFGKLERALRDVELLGGDLEHTRQRIRAAGLPAPTAGELKTMTQKAGQKSPASSFGKDEGGSATISGALGGVGKFFGEGKLPGGPKGPPGQMPRPDAKAAAIDALNVPRTLMTTADVSYSFRQGLVLGLGHPVKMAKAMGHQFRAFGSEAYAAKRSQMIADDRATPILKELGLELTDWTGKLGPAEEGFLSRSLAGVPIVRNSNRAGVTFLNELRFSVAKDALKASEIVSGKQPIVGKRASQLRGLMSFINAASGRGDLSMVSAEKLDALNGFLFSPRLIKSRLDVAAALPKAAFTRNPLLAKEAARDIAAVMVAGYGIMQLAQMAGAKVETESTSTDWGKIQVGNTRIDIWGGFQQYARLAAQMIAGKKTSLAGNVTEFKDDAPIADFFTGATGGGDTLESGFKKVPKSRAYELGRFVRSKLSPVVGTAVDLGSGSDYIGKENTLWSTVGGLVTPLSMQDIYDAIADDLAEGGSGAQGAAAGALGLLGFGSNTIPDDFDTTTPTVPEAISDALTEGTPLFRQDNVPTAKPTRTPGPTKTPTPTRTARPSTPRPSATPRRTASPTASYRPFSTPRRSP